MVESYAAPRASGEQVKEQGAGAATIVDFITADEFKARLAADGDNAKGRAKTSQVETEAVVAPKKKPKVKQPKPTGFEDYHADAPITPEEHAEERGLYDRSIPFPTRILTAIQRYERRRKMNAEVRDVFLTYLRYGGVTIGPNMFQGGKSKADLEGMDPGEVAAAMAQTSLTEEKYNLDNESSVWAIDFEGVMKGFLSRRVPYYYGFETKAQVDIVTKVLINFLNYLLHHDVCPEYADDIFAARRICNIANAEIWACAEAQRWLPGDFNIACSTLFDGSYAKLYDGRTTWTPEESAVKAFVGLTADVAREVVKFAIAGAASEEVYQAWYKMATEDSIETVEVIHAAGFEITAIDKVDNETRAFYKEHSTEYRPVGKVRARPWTNPEGPPEDLTPEEKEALRREARGDRPDNGKGSSTDIPETVYEFFIEEVILQHLFVGMKIEATVRKLNCGIWYFDEMLRALCSFDTYLCNELMIDWKEPRPVDRSPAKLGDDADLDEQVEE